MIKIDNSTYYKIQQIYSDYQNHYNIKLPKIIDIEYSDNNKSLSHFFVRDLFHKQYILYINKELLISNNFMIYQTLFHEFTHLFDSIQFINMDYNMFKNVMSSYSEFHASKREMDIRIYQSKQNNITLNTNITYLIKTTITDFMNMSYNILINKCTLMNNNSDLNNFTYDTNSIYYFLGYLKSLQSMKVRYIYKKELIPSSFQNIIDIISSELLTENINIQNVYLNHLKLQDIIKQIFITNKIKNGNILNW